ncbi:peroxiredoxin family protein [Candidatus Magnetominusculus dajiuhuensis]|uniref:peroxiredoxin family protein n=1 Tax=Candidatus Magnetominusculus dajiuhuensis TaxID=3137712 RepID=UPI003B42E2C4
MRQSIVIAMIAALLIIPAAAIAIPMEGQQAIEFSLPELHDASKTIALKDLRGKVVLLNIWASWCDGCQAEMPEFINLQEQYKDKPFIIVAVSVDNSKDKAFGFLEGLEQATKKKVNFTVLYDKDKTSPKDYKPRGMPASYLIDKNGKLARIFMGSFNTSNIGTLKSAIDEALR